MSSPSVYELLANTIRDEEGGIRANETNGSCWPLAWGRARVNGRCSRDIGSSRVYVDKLLVW
jgi:hypothetical protein